MKRLEEIFEEKKIQVYNSLNAEYEKRKEVADDLFHVSYKLFKEVNVQFLKLQNDYRPFGWVLINEMKDKKKENRHLSFDEQVLECTKSATEEERIRIVENIGELRAYDEFGIFLNGEVEMYLAKKKKIADEIEEDIVGTNEENEGGKNPDSTTARQVLLVHYIFQELNVTNRRTKSAKSRLIEMLTGKNETHISRILENPLGYKAPKGQVEDLKIVHKYFLDLELVNITNKIQQDLASIAQKEDK